MVFSEYLNNLFEPFGKKAGLSGHDMSLIWTPQILASLVQVPINLFTTELGAKLIDLVLGAIGGLAVGFGAVKGKAAAELEEMISYWITNLYVPAYGSSQLPAQISNLAAGIKSGNMSTIISSLYTGPTAAQNELSTYLGMFNPATYKASVSVPSVKPANVVKPINAYTPSVSVNKQMPATSDNALKMYSK